MTSDMIPKFVVLTILDGWGLAPDGAGNAISLANTPNMNKFWLSYPHTEIEAAGEAVGLPKGEDGNTETGHLNLGAGRIVYQDLERINMAIADGSFFENKVLQGAIDHINKYDSNLHYMGLLGGGGVHSNLNHLFALIHFASVAKVKKLFLHVFSDGRDSPPTAAKTYIAHLKEVIKKEGVGEIASIMGRYWAMDRDQRWDRTQKAYLALTMGKANKIKAPEEAIEISYSEGKTDEFIEPSIIVDKFGKARTLIKSNDAVIFFNFRIDRPRQLTKAFILNDFSKANVNFAFDSFSRYSKGSSQEVPKSIPPFERGNKINNLYFVTMTEYGKNLSDDGAKPAFPPEIIDVPISSVFSSSEVKQLKATESEKERFVTFYFNGLREKAFIGEDRIIVPSPSVATYDQKPEMSSEKITETLLNKITSDIYKFIVVNYPNADMVGHTGNIGPTVKAVEIIDSCLGKLATNILAYQGALIITADHGNAEEMINLETGEIDTEHSKNRVPFIVVYNKYLGKSHTLKTGILADVAPTIISFMGLPVPSSMTGRNLLAEIMKDN